MFTSPKRCGMNSCCLLSATTAITPGDIQQPAHNTRVITSVGWSVFTELFILTFLQVRISCIYKEKLKNFHTELFGGKAIP